MVKSDYKELNAYLERRNLIPVPITQEDSVSYDKQQAQVKTEPQAATILRYEAFPYPSQVSNYMAM